MTNLNVLSTCAGVPHGDIHNDAVAASQCPLVHGGCDGTPAPVDCDTVFAEGLIVQAAAQVECKDR